MSHDEIPHGMEKTGDSFKAMIPHIILMLLFYTAIIKMSSILASQIPRMQIFSGIVGSFQCPRYLIRGGLKIIVGGIAIMIMGGGVRRYGLTLKSDKLYIIPEVFTGILLILTQTGLFILPSMLSGRGFVMYSGSDLPQAVSQVSYNFLFHLGNCFGSLAVVFILHGVVQTYLMDKINRSITLRLWHFHVSCIIVTCIILIQIIIPFRQSLIGGYLKFFGAMLLLLVMLTFMCAYWYEKSRSLVAPAIVNVFHGFWFVFVVFLYNRFGG